MSNKHSAKHALVSSVIALVLCLAMFAGTTFAWFTDEVKSIDNIIASGTLDVKMSYSTDNVEWADASETAIFNYDNWEPGYSDLKFIKIENNGSLAFKYQLNILPAVLPEDAKVDLSDVIDVYFGIVGTDAKASATAKDTITDLGLENVGTLTDLINENDGAAHGILLPAKGKASADAALPEGVTAPEGDVTACIILHMQESAGNEYQGLGANNDFTVQLLATQYTYENDSFDNTYDAQAEYDPTAKLNLAKVTTLGDNMDEINAAIAENGGNTSWQCMTGTGDNHTSHELDVAYLFETVETYDEAQSNTYAKWHADFVVSADKDVPANSIGIAGNYGSYGWISFESPDVILANEEIRLLSLYDITMNYEELCLLVEKFYCGAYTLDAEKSEGITLNVELKLYEVEEPSPENGNSSNVETGNSLTVGSYKYTF